MDSVNFISVHVRGLRDRTKRLAIFFIGLKVRKGL